MLIDRLNRVLPANYVSFIKKEINTIEDTTAEDLEQLKYLATLNVLIDLVQQGWVFNISENELYLRMEDDNRNDKDIQRYRLSAERNAQFQNCSVINFISRLEKEHEYKGKTISIKNLIGNPAIILHAIKSKQKICDPYIQEATSNTRDIFTGYKLSEIWRYFRYTWSIPYKTMPGRNMYYLVRDRLQPYHPVIGIFALGNSVLNLTVRDDDIGWTIEAIKHNLKIRSEETFCEQIVSGTDGGKIKTRITTPAESQEEYKQRILLYSERIIQLLEQSLRTAISEIYTLDLGYKKQTRYPKKETVDRLQEIAVEYAKLSINNKNNEKSPNWREEAQSNLFCRKRASELAKLLNAQIVFNQSSGSPLERLNQLLANDTGRKAISTALIANRKCKIGSNMMEIIVCGAIPPYNELLGGKLISILACSPTIIRDYTKRYENQISEIASRMKGKKVIRDSRLVFLGTTSLYSTGSSQYNRIKVPLWDGGHLEFKRMGVTEGYGTVFFSQTTTHLFSKILEMEDGGKRINHVFGEGTSPRFRMISKGLHDLGIRSDAFLKHYSPRIVYSMCLARNTKEFLMGFDSDVDFGLNINNTREVEEKTQYLIDYWYNRWLMARIQNVNIEERLGQFQISDLLLGKICGGVK